MILKTFKFILQLPFKILGIILAILVIIRYGGLKRASLKMKKWQGDVGEAIKANKSKSK